MNGTERIDLTDPRIERAVKELRSMISQRYPDATFNLTYGEDPEGVYLKPVVDVEDTTEVFDVVGDRLLDMQVEEELPIYVVPVRPLASILAKMRKPERQPRSSIAVGP